MTHRKVKRCYAKGKYSSIHAWFFLMSGSFSPQKLYRFIFRFSISNYIFSSEEGKL